MCLLGISWTIYGYVAGKAPKIGIPMSALLLGNAVGAMVLPALNGGFKRAKS